MSGPQLTQYVQGVTSVSADELNTFLQGCVTTAQLANFVGLTGMQVNVLGFNTPGDGGQGVFHWASGSYTNDGVNTIVPTGASSGAWLRLPTATFGALFNFLGGLGLSTAGGSGTFSVAKGQATDGTNATLMTLAAAIAKTTASWAVGTGNGGLDTGTITTGTWYHVFVITNSNTVDVLFSLSPTSPTLPAGYLLFRRIGSMKTDGSSHWTSFTQLGNQFVWAAATGRDVDYNVTTAQLAKTVNVPTGVVVTARLRGIFTGPDSTNTSCLVSSPEESGVTGSTPGETTVTVYVTADLTGNATEAFSLDVLTNASAQVNCVASGSGASNVLRFSAYGWTDTRGQV